MEKMTITNKNQQTLMSQRGFSQKYKYSLILCKLIKKAVNDSLQHRRFHNHVVYHNPILRT